MWPFRRERELGRRGEELARRFLRRAGMKILATNYRCPSGEADIIALDTSTRKTFGAETIAFVEVKTRSCDRYTDPEAAVDSRKQRRLKKIAAHYLSKRRAERYSIRFDIVAIVAREGEKPTVRHIPGAF